MKTAELQGAMLDYHTGRAEGIPAEQLAIIQGFGGELSCIRTVPHDQFVGRDFARYNPSTDWRLAGGLIEKHRIDLHQYEAGWVASLSIAGCGDGPTPQVAICRAVVRAAFGDDVDEVAVCE